MSHPLSRSRAATISRFWFLRFLPPLFHTARFSWLRFCAAGFHGDAFVLSDCTVAGVDQFCFRASLATRRFFFKSKTQHATKLTLQAYWTRTGTLL